MESAMNEMVKGDEPTIEELALADGENGDLTAEALTSAQGGRRHHHRHHHHRHHRRYPDFYDRYYYW